MACMADVSDMKREVIKISSLLSSFQQNTASNLLVTVLRYLHTLLLRLFHLPIELDKKKDMGHTDPAFVTTPQTYQVIPRRTFTQSPKDCDLQCGC